jgi:hypothetical protein
MTEPKPCKLCGEMPVIHHSYSDGLWYAASWQGYGNEFGHTVGETKMCQVSAPTLTDAIAAWNKAQE